MLVTCASSAWRDATRSRSLRTGARRISKSPSQAQEKLTHDPWIDVDHVTVTTRNGVVKAEATVADVLGLLRILRLCRKIPDARRVVSEVEINAQLPESG